MSFTDRCGTNLQNSVITTPRVCLLTQGSPLVKMYNIQKKKNPVLTVAGFMLL